MLVMKKLPLFLVALWLSESYCRSHSSNSWSNQYALREEYSWGAQEFHFPNATARNIALKTGSYIPANNDIYAVRAWEDKIFVSVFRTKVGIASSFNYFSTNTGSKSPVLIPYPSFDANYISEAHHDRTMSLPSPASIVCSAYFRIDKCDRLWVIDAGITDFFGERRIVAPPAIVVFDLKTHTLLRRYIIPRAFVNSETTFINLDIDLKGNSCDDAYAYVADLFRSVVVYSWKKDRSWRLTHNFFGSDPHAGNFYYEGVNFQWNFGIVDIAIGEHYRDGSRRVYIKPFASTKTYYISNKVLQNEAYINSNNYFYDVHLLGDRGKNGQVYEYAYDEKTNVLLYAQLNRELIGCWNPANSYINQNFDIVYETTPLFFPPDISIDKKRNVWVVSNNYPLFVYGPWNPSAKNVRVFKGKVDDLISGTVCKYKTFNNPKPYLN